jgi:hypothetical protein
MEEKIFEYLHIKNEELNDKLDSIGPSNYDASVVASLLGQLRLINDLMQICLEGMKISVDEMKK